MSTNYEGPGRRENHRRETTEWPQLIVPDRAKMDRPASGNDRTAQRMNRAASGTEHPARRMNRETSRVGHSAHRVNGETSRAGHSVHRVNGETSRAGHSAHRVNGETSRAGHSAHRVNREASRAEYSAHRTSRTASGTERRAGRVMAEAAVTDNRRRSAGQETADSARRAAGTGTRTGDSRRKAAGKNQSSSKKAASKQQSAIGGNVGEWISAFKKAAGFSETQNAVSILKAMKHIFLFPLVFLYFEILLRIFGETGIFSHFVYPLIFSIATGLFWACITSFFKRKVNRIITIMVLLASGLLFIVECLVRDSFQVYMNFKSIISGAGGVVGGFASELINSIIYGIPVMLLFFLPGILYIIFGKKILPARRQKRPMVVMLLVCAVIFMGIGSLTASIGSSKTQYTTQYDFDATTKYFGLLTSVRLDGQRAVFGGGEAETLGFESVSADAGDKEEDKAAEEEKPEVEEKVYGENVLDLKLDELIESTSDETIANMHSYVNSQTPSKQNAYTGLFEGKNLILICAEALSDVAVNKNLTPTLYRMVHNGIYFSDFYQPTWGGSTSSGEYSFVTGLAPLSGAKSMVETQNKNMYYTMGNQLQRLGYYSRAYHNGLYDFYSRHLTHENLGYEEYLATGNGIEDLTGKHPKDSVMFDKTMDTYIDKQPFSIYYMTISGHCTYQSTDWRVKENLDAVKAEYGDRFKDTTNYYMCYQMELEKALTLMVEKLEEAGIADDTVICITSDHYPYGLEKTSTFGNNEDYVSDLYGYKPKTSWENDHNSWVLWSGCLENENKDMACEISTPTYSLDIVPTLSNLFGLEYDSRLLVGRDVFSDADPLVLWTNHSWMTDKGKFDSATGKFYPNEGVEVDDEYVKNMKSVVANKLTYSSEAIKKDYFNVLFGK